MSILHKDEHTTMNNELKTGTALITGASSGLGEAFARRLAADHYDLILIARREELLRALAKELYKKFAVRVEVWPADLSADEGIAGVAERIALRNDLTMLINNAGFGHGGSYYKIEAKPQMDMIHVHVVATARLTRAVLPQMVERNQGAIINVASVAAFSVVGRSAMYGSTKTWIVAFSRAIGEELRSLHVKIQALCPGFTITGFHDTLEFKKFDRSRIPKFLWTTSDKVVAAALKALKRKKVVFIPGFLNKVMATIPRMPLGQSLARLYTLRKV